MNVTDAEILDAFRRCGSKRAAAAALGMDRSSFRYRLKRLMPEATCAPNAPREEQDADPVVVRRLRDENARLTRALTEDQRKRAFEEDVLEIIGEMAATPSSPPEWLVEPKDRRDRKMPEVPVMVFADWHIGETVSRSETNGINEYDPEIAGERVRRLVTAVVDLARNHGPGVYPGAVVNLLGDFVSGGLHPELAKSDAEEVIPSALRAVDLLEWSLTTLADEFGHLYVPCVAGNHGRSTQKPEFKRYVFKNFDWLIYQFLMRRFKDDDRVVFDVPDTNEVLYRVFGHRYLAMHGDQMGVKGGDGIIGALGPIARGEVKVGKQAAAIRRDYDTLVIGHWHQEIVLPRIIVANSMKGWDEFARLALRAPPSTPSQPLWFVHPKRGRTSYWNVTVDEPINAVESEWVSVFKEAA